MVSTTSLTAGKVNDLLSFSIVRFYRTLTFITTSQGIWASAYNFIYLIGEHYVPLSFIDFHKKFFFRVR